MYAYRCGDCGAEADVLQERGADPPPEGCATCGGPLRKRFSRVAVRYGSWGFTRTDSLVSDTRGKDFKALRERAERIGDSN